MNKKAIVAKMPIGNSYANQDLACLFTGTTQPILFCGSLIIPSSNTGSTTLGKSANATGANLVDVPVANGQSHPFRSVDLSTLKVKSTLASGDFVILIGEEVERSLISEVLS